MVKKNDETRKGFFTAVIDVDTKFGTINDMKEYDTYRYFNEKFVDSPEMALAIAADLDNKRWKAECREDVEALMKDMKYDPENDEYVIKKVYTTNWNEPTENQYKKFIAGEYEFYVQTIYIQILRTDLISGNLTSKAISTWMKRLENA